MAWLRRRRRADSEHRAELGFDGGHERVALAAGFAAGADFDASPTVIVASTGPCTVTLPVRSSSNRSTVSMIRAWGVPSAM